MNDNKVNEDRDGDSDNSDDNEEKKDHNAIIEEIEEESKSSSDHQSNGDDSQVDIDMINLAESYPLKPKPKLL